MQAKKLAILKLNWSLVRKKENFIFTLQRGLCLASFKHHHHQPGKLGKTFLTLLNPLANVPGVGPKSTMRNSADIQAFI